MTKPNPSAKPHKAKEAKSPTSLERQERRFTAEGAPPPGWVGHAPPDAEPTSPASKPLKHDR